MHTYIPTTILRLKEPTRAIANGGDAMQTYLPTATLRFGPLHGESTPREEQLSASWGAHPQKQSQASRGAHPQKQWQPTPDKQLLEPAPWGEQSPEHYVGLGPTWGSRVPSHVELMLALRGNQTREHFMVLSLWGDQAQEHMPVLRERQTQGQLSWGSWAPSQFKRKPGDLFFGGQR